MTKREMMEKVIAGEISAEVIEMAKAEIVKMDEKNAKRREGISKKAKENAPIKEAILKAVGEDKKLAKEISEVVGISTQKASALCRQMVGEGVLKVEDVKVKGKGVQKAYSVC